MVHPTGVVFLQRAKSKRSVSGVLRYFVLMSLYNKGSGKKCKRKTVPKDSLFLLAIIIPLPQSGTPDRSCLFANRQKVNEA